MFCARGIVVASTGLLSCTSVKRSVASFDDAPRGGLAPALTHYPLQSRVEEISDDIPCRIKFLSCCIVDMVAVSRQSACALGKDEVFGVSLGLLYPVKLHASRDTQMDADQVSARCGGCDAIRIKRSSSLSQRGKNMSCCCCRREIGRDGCGGVWQKTSQSIRTREGKSVERGR